MRFNKQTIDGLSVPVGKAQALFWDDAVRGFGIKLNAGGTRQWVAQYRTPDGRTPRITIGRADTISLDEARKQARTILAKAQTGADPQAEKAATRAEAAVTLGAVADAYLKRAKIRLKPRSYEEVYRHLTKAWQPLRSRPIASVKRADVAAQLNIIAETGPVNANRARAALSGLFSYAVGEGICEANPTIGTNRPTAETSRDRVLTDAELAAIWRCCRDDDYGFLVRVLMLTGQRREEVGGMDEAELDLPGAVWTIPASRTKNKRAHTVPLAPATVDLLTRKPRIQGRALVFGLGVGGFSGWSNSKERLDKRIAESGAVVAPWRLHDLRRSAASGMARLRTPVETIEKVLNHSSGTFRGVVGIYQRHDYADEKREALIRWAEHIVKLCE